VTQGGDYENSTAVLGKGEGGERGAQILLLLVCGVRGRNRRKSRGKSTSASSPPLIHRIKARETHRLYRRHKTKRMETEGLSNKPLLSKKNVEATSRRTSKKKSKRNLGRIATRGLHGETKNLGTHRAGTHLILVARNRRDINRNPLQQVPPRETVREEEKNLFSRGSYLAYRTGQ